MGSRGTSTLASLGSLTKQQYLNDVGDAPGLSSKDGKLKHITLYHGSFSDFDKFDYSKKEKVGMDQYGQGFYFTDSVEKARMFGDIIYTVDVAYSTNFKVAKKTGREKDFTYQPDTGYWIIPANKANNLKIRKKTNIS